MNRESQPVKSNTGYVQCLKKRAIFNQNNLDKTSFLQEQLTYIRESVGILSEEHKLQKILIKFVEMRKKAS